MAANNRLRAARALRGMTQLQLAAATGIREIDISRYETGRAQPRPEVKLRIAKALDRTCYELFTL